MSSAGRRSSNTVWQPASVDRRQRQARNGHRAAVLWLTGLSAAGKTSLAQALEAELFGRGQQTYVLDGDNVRHGLCGDLGFSLADRSENIRRVAETARLFVDAGVLVIAAFISPLRADRAAARRLFAPGDFIEIWCQAPLEVCEARDVKGLYARARAGEIADFTGVNSPYEAPETPELVVPTGELSLAVCVDRVLNELVARGLLAAPAA